MTLEISLKPPLSLPRFLQAQKDEPRRDIHWVGHKKEAESQQDSGGKNSQTPKPDNTQGYRPLSSITLGDVGEAQKFFAGQLIPSPYPAWVGVNHFCNLTLARKRDGRPPMIFGRVKTCYPTDGYINNIQDIELHFPHKMGQPDPILLSMEDIVPPPQGVLQSYGVRVKFLASPEDIADFQSFENSFTEQGFTLDFSSDYIDLLHLDEFNKGSHPWFHVVGSRWFASIPDSVQDEVRKSLKSLIGWNNLIFNYHPKWMSPDVRTLNHELDFNYGFSEHYLITPQDTQQTAHIVAVAFNKIFMQPMK
jgi:hypothetical protein